MATPSPNADVVAVVTINWNGAANTLRSLAALRATEGAAWHLYIVDNASTDDSLDRLDREAEGATIIRSATNAGWTGGNNQGIERALGEGHDFVLILNNDAFVRPSTIATLLAVFADQRDSMPVLGPVHRGAGSRQYDFTVAHRDPKTGIPAWTRPDDLGPETAQPTFPTAYISGAGVLIHRRHFEAVGMLDDRFYLNFDDTDWCARAEERGFPLLMVRDAVIDHIGSASIGGVRSPLQTYFLTRNRLLYAEKHGRLLDRLRLVRRYVWQARDLFGGRATRIVRSPADPVAAAFRRGVLDYLARRFGDCPAEIRTAQARSSAALAG